MRFHPVGFDEQNKRESYWCLSNLKLYQDWEKSPSPWDCDLWPWQNWEVVRHQLDNCQEKSNRKEQRRKLRSTSEGEEKEAELVQEPSRLKSWRKDIVNRDKEHLSKMSEELTKLAKLANNAAGDYKPDYKSNSTHNMSPQNFVKYHGGPVMGPVKEDKTVRVKSEMGPNYNNKLDNMKEETLNNASFNNLKTIDVKKESIVSDLKKEEIKKEENGGVFHENISGSNTDQLDVKSLPVSQHDKLRSSPNWSNKQTDSHTAMGRENNRIDGQPYPHMPMQYPQHYQGLNQGHHQSHVFSTLLANRAAQAVYTGQAKSIITFHQSLSASRKFLDPDQDIKVDPPSSTNQPPTNTPTPPQPTNERTDPNGTPSNPSNGSQPTAAQKNDLADNSNNLKGTNSSTENQSTTTNTNGTKEDVNTTDQTKSSAGPTTPQSNAGVEPSPARPPAASESAPPTKSIRGGGKKSGGKRKRSQSSQPLHPTMPPVGPNMAMQQGMPPSGPSFGPFPRGPYGPANGPYPPQSPQMPMRPGMPAQAGMGPSTTETENLDPSALWENPPSNKRQMLSTMAPSWSQQDFAIGDQAMPGSMGPQGPGMMPPRPEGMMGQKSFMSPNSQNPLEQFPVSMSGAPYDMANFPAGQPMDNLTPEQMRHREERLRTLKEMQKMLFPEEHQNASPSPGRMMSPHGTMPPQEIGPGMMSPSGGMMMPMGPSAMMGPNGPHPMMGGAMHPRMPHPPPEALRGMTPAEQQRFMMSQQAMPPPLPQDFDTMTPEQKAWVKLQQEFYVEKHRKMMEEQAKMQQSHMMDFPGRGPPMRFGPGPGHGPFPPGEVGQTMPPPPPYHASHSAASLLQRRASMSGSFSPGGGAPPGSFCPMSPHGMSTTQPQARLARSNSLPSAQMPMGPGGSMPMQGSLSPESSPIRTPFRASTPTPASLTGGSNASMNSGMNPGSASNMNTMSGGPMSAPAMTSSINSPGMSMNAQSCDNTPLNNTMVHTPGSMVVHSPHPNQPGTPVVDQSMQGGTPGNIRQGTPNPGTPTPAVSVAKQAMVTSGTQRCSPKPNMEQSNMTKSSDNPPSNGDTRKSGDIKLVNFPPSQLNRDKAPNFPPRGDDIQQYTSTFYQKTISKESQQGPNRMPQFGPSPISRSPMNQEIMGPQGGGNMIPSEANMMSQGMMNNSQSVMTQSNRMMTSQPNMMTSQPNMIASQPNMMTSQPNIITSQSNMMTSQSNMMSQPRTSQSRMMTSQSQPMISSPHLTSQSNMMTSQSNMMTSHANMMSQSNMMQSQPGMMTSQSNMMPSQSNIMPSPTGMMSSQAGMTSSAGMVPNSMMESQSAMMNSDSQMMSPSARMMASQGRGPINSNGPMMSSPGMRMTNPQGMIGPDGMSGPGVTPTGGPMMSVPGRPSSTGMMSPHMTAMNNPDMVMPNAKSQGHLMQTGMGPGHPNPMDGMPGHMDMTQVGNHVPANMSSRFPNPKAAMMESGGIVEGGMPQVRGGMMADGVPMDQVMDHPMNRQMMPGMRQPQPTSPLSLLQTRFSPPLPPDGKGPTKTLQYFPPGSANAQGGVQGQGGNPHLNPTPNQASPAPSQGPKQIQMPFPMEMITSGPNSSPSLTQGFGPHRMQGMGMSARLMQSDMMYPHHHGEYPGGPRGPSPVAYMGGPRQGMPYGPMQHIGPSRMPGMSMGPGMPGGYMEPSFGPQPVPGMSGMAGPMGAGYNMPR